MAAKKQATEKHQTVKEETPAPEPQPTEVPGWPGVVAETPEEHDARRRAEAETAA